MAGALPSTLRRHESNLHDDSKQAVGPANSSQPLRREADTPVVFNNRYNNAIYFNNDFYTFTDYYTHTLMNVTRLKMVIQLNINFSIYSIFSVLCTVFHHPINIHLYCTMCFTF